MDPVGKALWFLDSHATAPLTLADVAHAAGVGRYHLSRAFGLATGYPVMGYLRARRLTEAARVLANGAADILAVALDAGYGSHEAFTRAFHDQFGVTPEQTRAVGRIDHLELVEPIVPATEPQEDLKPQRFVASEPLLLAGLCGRFTLRDAGAIAQQWRHFYQDHLCHREFLPARCDDAIYGGFSNFDDDGGFDYLSGVAVAGYSRLPAEWSRLRVPAQRYAVFEHREHIATIGDSWRGIWNRWLPESGHTPADAPSFERLRRFDTERGTGDIELWLALVS